MNTNQYTQKTLEALQAAQQLAVEYQHNALEPEHLLHALATQEQGLIPPAAPETECGRRQLLRRCGRKAFRNAPGVRLWP